MLESLSDEVGGDRTLLVLCKAFRGKATFENLTVKKIPKAVMTKCEWGKDDYSLAIRDLPAPPPELSEDDHEAAPKRGKKKVLRGSRKPKPEEPSLFSAHTDKKSSGKGSARGSKR